MPQTSFPHWKVISGKAGSRWGGGGGACVCMRGILSPSNSNYILSTCPTDSGFREILMKEKSSSLLGRLELAELPNHPNYT